MDKKNQGKGEKNVDRKPPRGIVRRADSKEAESGGDETFAPDYTVTSTTDGGGKVLTDVEVILIFWGSFWTSTPAPTPSSDTYKTAIEGIFSASDMNGLRQYRGACHACWAIRSLHRHRSGGFVHGLRRRQADHEPAE